MKTEDLGGLLPSGSGMDNEMCNFKTGASG